VVPPANQSVPKQEPGLRPARALPYTLNAHGLLQLSDGSFLIEFENTGNATAVFQVRSGSNLHVPRTYTVEPGKSLSDNWPLASLGIAKCDLSVYGPNGFFRGFGGSVSALHQAQLDVRALYDGGDGVVLMIKNPSSHTADVTVADRYSGKEVELTINAGQSDSRHFPVNRFAGWYDFVITVASDPSIKYQFAGHLENGKDSTSDPALSRED
jgi:phospholipase C